MTREQLLTKICLNACKDICIIVCCEHCNVILNELLDDYDNHVIEQYKANTDIKNTIREIHDNVSEEMYCKAIDEYKNALLKLIKDEQDTRYGYLDEKDIREVAKTVKERCKI